jgi:sugar phosphate isomerase/epimerase
MITNPLSRRDFIQRSLLTLPALGLASRLSAQAVGRKLPLALQLYSVRADCARDFDGTLAEVAKLGFDGVEFAGYHTYSGKPKELRQRLDDLGLKAAATHIGTGSLRGDALPKTIEFHQILGCKFLISPGDRDFNHPERSQALAETFNQAAAVLKPVGLACGYHNHTSEFQKANGLTWFDLFAQRTSQDVVLQQDVGWTVAAGHDPIALMKKYRGRMKSTHFKPAVVGDDQAKGKKPLIGQDSIDWPAVIAACIQYGGTEWITLEQESYPDGKTPMEATVASFAALAKMV